MSVSSYDYYCTVCSYLVILLYIKFVSNTVQYVCI